MRVHLQYGREGLDVEIPGASVTVLEPRFVPGRGVTRIIRPRSAAGAGAGRSGP